MSKFTIQISASQLPVVTLSLGAQQMMISNQLRNVSELQEINR